MAGRINTIMQTCFFAISGVLPRDEAIAQNQGRRSRRPTAGKGSELVEQNFAAVDRTLENLHEVALPGDGDEHARAAPARARATRRRSCRHVTAMMIAGRGDDLPVSAMPARRHVPIRHGTVGEAQHLGHRPGLEAGHLHPVRQLRDGVPARGDPRALLRRVGARGRARRVSRRRRSPAAASPTCGSRCRLRSRTAPAASSASRPARRAASKRQASAPSTWTQRRRSSSASGATWRSSTRCPTTSRRAWTRRSCAACST